MLPRPRKWTFSKDDPNQLILESLTSGMYSDSYVVFREYIQNSVDSIDEAVRLGVLIPGAEQIVVRLAPTENQIVITDNGLGIPSTEVSI